MGGDFDDYHRYDDYERPRRRALAHSGPGITSFAVGLLAMFGEIAVIAIAGVIGMNAAGGGPDPGTLQAIGFGALAGGGLAVIGVILGIVGMALPDRKKAFAIIGTCVNALVIFGLCGLMCLGVAAQGGVR